MKIIEQAEQIDAKLLAQGHEWFMLAILPDPNINMNGTFREYVFQFRVVNKDGFAQPILVSRNNFVIVPLLEPLVLNVKYYEENEKEVEEKTELKLVETVILH